MHGLSSFTVNQKLRSTWLFCENEQAEEILLRLWVRVSVGVSCQAEEPMNEARGPPEAALLRRTRVRLHIHNHTPLAKDPKILDNVRLTTHALARAIQRAATA